MNRSFECSLCNKTEELEKLSEFQREDLLCKECGTGLKFGQFAWSVVHSFISFNISTLLGYLVVFSKWYFTSLIIILIALIVFIVLKSGSVTYTNQEAMKLSHLVQRILGWIVGLGILIVQFCLV